MAISRYNVYGRSEELKEQEGKEDFTTQLEAVYETSAIGMKASNPELIMDVKSREPDYEYIKNRKANLAKYPLEDREALSYARNAEEELNILQMREKDKENMDIIGRMGLAKTIALTAVTEAINPLNYVPIAGQMSNINKTNKMLDNIKKVEAVKAMHKQNTKVANSITAQMAGIAYLEEDMREEEGLDSDKIGAVGFAALTTLPVTHLIKHFSNRKITKALLAEDDMAEMYGNNNRVVYEDTGIEGEAPRVKEVPMEKNMEEEVMKVPTNRFLSLNGVLDSDIMKGLSDDLNEVRRFFYRLGSGVSAGTDANGNIVKNIKNVEHKRKTYEAPTKSSGKDVDNMYKEAIEDGSFQGTHEEFNNEVTNTMRQASKEQRAEYQEIKEQLEIQEKERIASEKEQFQQEIDLETLPEKTLILDSIKKDKEQLGYDKKAINTLYKNSMEVRKKQELAKIDKEIKTEQDAYKAQETEYADNLKKFKGSKKIELKAFGTQLKTLKKKRDTLDSKISQAVGKMSSKAKTEMSNQIKKEINNEINKLTLKTDNARKATKNMAEKRKLTVEKDKEVARIKLKLKERLRDIDKTAQDIRNTKIKADLKEVNKEIDSITKQMGDGKKFNLERQEFFTKGQRRPKNKDWNIIRSQKLQKAMKGFSIEADKLRTQRTKEVVGATKTKTEVKRQDFNTKVKESRGKKREVRDVKKEELAKRRKELKKEAMDKTKIVFKSNNKHINNAAMRYHKGFGDSLQISKDLGVKEAQDISGNAIYVKRKWRPEILRKADPKELKRDIKEALLAHPSNKLTDKKALQVAIDNVYKTLTDFSFDSSILSNPYIAPTKLSGNSELRNIKLKLDDTIMSKYLDNNMHMLNQTHGHKTSRSQSLQYGFGTNNIDEISEEWLKPMKDALIKAGRGDDVSKIMVAASNALEEARGTLRMAKDGNTIANRVVKGVTSFNASTSLGMSGVWSLPELTNVLWGTGLKGLFNGSLGKTVKGVKQMMFDNAKAGDFELMNEIYMLNIVSEGGLETRALMHADTDGIMDINKADYIQSGLDKFNEGFFKWNMMRPIQSFNENMAAVNHINNIPDMYKKFKKGLATDVDKKKLARMGLDFEDLELINMNIEKYAKYDDKGLLVEMDILKWDPEARENLSMSARQTVTENVMQPDDINISTSFKKNTPFRKIVLQFLRFSATANNRLLQRGWQDDPAGLIGATANYLVVHMTLKYLMEQADIALGYTNERDNKFDIFNNPDAVKNLTVQGINYLPHTGLLATATQLATSVSGNNQLGTEYGGKVTDALGISMSKAESGQELLNVLTTGEWHDKKSWNALKAFTIAGNAPGVKHVLDYGAEQMNLK